MNKKVVVFGSGGQLGSFLMDILSDSVGFTHEQADINDRQKLERIFKDESPEIVINASAYNKVEEAEVDPQKAFAVNALGPFNLAGLSKEHGAVFLHVSTDYVFDGVGGNFVETDKPNPINTYGLSKYAGEKLVTFQNPDSYIVRTSAVYGGAPSGQKKNFADRMVEMARAGQEIKVVGDQYTCPTFARDLAEKIAEILDRKAAPGIYHVTGQGSCSWYDFAAKIFEILGIPATLKKISTEESGTRVNRPRMSFLSSEYMQRQGIGLLPDWRVSLERYLSEKYKIQP